MASVVYATPGTLHVDPTTAATGGVELKGILARDIRFDPGIETRRRRTGFGADSGFRERRGRVRPARFVVGLRSQAAAALKVLLSHLTTDGSTMRPRGGTSAAPFAKMPTFGLVLRPDDTGEKYIYGPNWSLTQESQIMLTHSDDFSQLDGAVLVLEAGRPTNATGPAWLWDTAANVDSVYGLGGGA